MGVYQSWRAKSGIEQGRTLILAWMAVHIFLIVAAFLTKSGQTFSREWLIVWFICGIVYYLAIRAAAYAVLRAIRKRGWNRKRLLVLGAGPMAGDLMRRLHQARWAGFTVEGFLDDNPDLHGKEFCGAAVKGPIANLERILSELVIDEVWIVLPLRAEERVRDILHELRHTTVAVRYFIDIEGLRLINHSVTDMLGIPVINLTESPLNGINRIIKAIEDRVLATIILLLCIPVFLGVAIGVKLSSSGPVFYRQERVGWNGRKFMMLKFRSMPVDVEKNGVQWGGAGSSKQPTRFGAFLRRTSLDELPQFINVLKGDMSIVGPRPERPMFVDKFKDEIPNYMKKHLVKAGITGWAQVNGWRGDTDIAMRVEYDLYYIENWSLWFDLKIIVLTIFKGFVNKNAY
ncbi:MAG: undecaprenyl-phosphate glucose phosphotransferase [Thiohalomonadaceae bacterium]